MVREDLFRRVSPGRSISTQSGRSLLFREIHQWEIYEGLLVGFPSRETNDGIKAGAVEHARSFSRDTEPHLIPPVMREFEDPRPRHRHEKRSMLPPVVCIALLDSYQPVRNPDATGSHLSVVWFQDGFVFPVDPAIKEYLETFSWEEYAVDYTL